MSFYAALKLKILISKYKYLLILAAAGIFLLLLPYGSSGDKDSESAQSVDETPAFSVEAEEKRIAEALSKAEGLGSVEVVLTVKTSSENVYQNDISTNEQETGDNTSQISEESRTVLISEGSGTQRAVLVKTLYPEYQGALVICDDGDKADVKLAIVKAMRALTGLGSDRVVVMPKK
jgi:stage III sporulation protein AG